MALKTRFKARGNGVVVNQIGQKRDGSSAKGRKSRVAVVARTTKKPLVQKRPHSDRTFVHHKSGSGVFKRQIALFKGLVAPDDVRNRVEGRNCVGIFNFSGQSERARSARGGDFGFNPTVAQRLSGRFELKTKSLSRFPAKKEFHGVNAFVVKNRASVANFEVLRAVADRALPKRQTARVTFHFLPPSPDEAQGVSRFQLATVLAMATIGILLAVPHQNAAPLLAGALTAVMLNFFRVQSAFDKRKLRGNKGEIALQRDHLRIFDGKREILIPWEKIEKLDTQNGKLAIFWSGKTQILALREVENGMKLAHELGKRLGKGGAPSNFIPLSSL